MLDMPESETAVGQNAVGILVKEVDIMVEKLRQMKEKSHMTNQQIAEKSNIPESTVARIFSGKTPNPTIATVIAMARAMGGSAADFFNEDGTETDNAQAADGNDGLLSAAECRTEMLAEAAEKGNASEDERNVSADDENHAGNSSREEYYEDIISFYNNALKKKDEWISRLFWCLVAVMLFILFVLVFDILHPDLGYVKY